MGRERESFALEVSSGRSVAEGRIWALPLKWVGRDSVEPPLGLEAEADAVGLQT